MPEIRFLDPRLQPSVYFDRLLDSVLYIVIKTNCDQEAGSDETWSAQIFPTSEGNFILGFENELDLSEFLSSEAYFIQLPARALIEKMADDEVGLALNLGTEYEYTVPSDAMKWLAEQLNVSVNYGHERPHAFSLAEPLSAWHTVLAQKLQPIVDIVPHFYWVNAEFPEAQSPALIFLDAPSDIAQTIAETVFQAVSLLDRDENGVTRERTIEVLFFKIDDPLVLPMIEVAKVIEVPIPAAPTPAVQEHPQGPGMDPSAPPILR